MAISKGPEVAGGRYWLFGRLH